jgi:hypothetical protein
MNIIGICGQKNSGKSTIARMIAVLTPGTVEVQLAAPMKRFCADVFGWTDERLNGPSEMREKPDARYLRGYFCSACGDGDTKSSTCLCGSLKAPTAVYLTPRFALQRLGTAFGRACYEDVWIDYALRMATRLLLEKMSVVVIPDVRFVNEARRIREVGGQVWRVRRCASTETQGGATPDTHASEREQFSSAMDKYVAHDIENLPTMNLTALRELVKSLLETRGAT